MKKHYFIKKTMSFVLSMIMMLTSSTVLAQENTNLPDNRNYFIVNGTETVYEGEDYENPETGEYLPSIALKNLCGNLLMFCQWDCTCHFLSVNYRAGNCICS